MKSIKRKLDWRLHNIMVAQKRLQEKLEAVLAENAATDWGRMNKSARKFYIDRKNNRHKDLLKVEELKG